MFDEPIDDDAGLTPAQRELENALRDLRPARPNIDRDRMMFKAGAASARRSLNVWRAAAAVLVLGNAAAVTFALRSAQPDRANQVVDAQPPPLVTEQPASQPVVVHASWDPPLPSPGRPLMPSADAGYLAVRDAVLRWGVAALPAQASGPRASAQSPDVRQLLDLPREQEAPPASPWAPLSAPIRRLFSGDHL